MLVFKLSCKLAMCYAGGQTLEKRQIAGNHVWELNLINFNIQFVHLRDNSPTLKRFLVFNSCMHE